MDLFYKALNFVNENKDAFELFAAVVIYILGHRQAAFSYAKKKASTLILAAEKGAEELLLNSGTQKMDWVVQKAYSNLPARYRLILNLDDFRKVAQKLIDNSKQVINEASKPAVVNAAPSTAPKAPVESGESNGSGV